MSGTELLLRPHPFTMEHGACTVKSGQTLLAMLEEAAMGAELSQNLRVEIGGYDVPAEMWHRVRPREGTLIHVTRMPAGSSGRKVLRTILLVAVAAVAIWFTGPAGVAMFGATGAAIAGAAVGILGALLVNALVPPAKPKLASNNLGDAGNLYGLTGSQNNINPYGAIPIVIGESRFFPPHAALPYSESLGTESYHHYMFDLGLGDIEVSDITIGETSITEFEDVEYEITTTPTLYTNDVQEESLAIALADNTDAVRVTAPDVDEISCDVTFPQGLFGMDTKGRLVAVSTPLTFQYRVAGSTGAWTSVPLTAGTKTRLVNINGGFFNFAVNVPANTPDRKPFASSCAWKVPRGQYEVRVARGSTNWGSSDANSRIGDAAWTALRSIRNVNPSTTGTTKLCMRIRASDQLNGTLDNVSCLVRQKIKVWDQVAGAWTPPIVNRSPAWIYYWLCTACPAVKKLVPESRMDLQNITDFDDFCVVNDFEVRGVLDTSVPMRQLIDDVLACAMGSVRIRDGKYGVVFDSGTTVPTMAFTPLETQNFSVQKPYPTRPHALRVRFRNPNVNWQEDEIVVVADGYSWRGKDARGLPSSDPEPTLFETMTLRWIGDAHSAWRIARMHLAQAYYRSTTYSWDTDIANLACVRGDLVYVAHDVVEWGDAWGRIKSIVGRTITTDESVALDAGVEYTIRIRRWDGSTPAFAFTQTAPNQFLLSSDPVDVSVGDVLVVGATTTMNERILVTAIKPSADLGAKLMGVRYDPRVAPYWANPPAAIVSEITGTAYLDPPWAPNIVVVISDDKNSTPSDTGSVGQETHVYMPPRSGVLAGGGATRNRYFFKER